MLDFFTGGAIGALADDPMIQKDIYIPFKVTPLKPGALRTQDERATMTHEYGHFVMCDALDEAGALRHLYDKRAIEEDFSETPGSHAGILIESFADLFASQVAGAVNYPNLQTGAWPSGSNRYALGLAALERNYYGDSVTADRADSTPFENEIGRIISTFHDAFDHASPWRGVPGEYVATDANGWLDINPFVYPVMLVGFGGFPVLYAVGTVDDDRVRLPATALHEWLLTMPETWHWNFDAGRFALAQVMRNHGSTWCDICELFAVHEPALGALGLSRQQLWYQCLSHWWSTELSTIVGEPPEPTARLDGTTCQPCAPGEYSDPTGVCARCDVDNREIVVNNVCSTCADGWVGAADGLHCVQCQANERTVGNSCVACQYPQQPNAAHDACIECPMDAVIDAADFNATACGDGVFDLKVDSGPGDVCPDAFWLEVRNVDGFAAGGPTPSALRFDAYLFGDMSSCETSEASIYVAAILDDTNVIPAQEVMTILRLTHGATCTQYGTQGCPASCEHVAYPIWSYPPEELSSRGISRLRLQIKPDGWLKRTDFFVSAPQLCAVGQ